MNSKYLLNPIYADNQIITKTSDGTEILVTKDTFNDYFAECMLKNNQHHLVISNVHYDPKEDEKKSFVQTSENVITLTSTPEQIAENAQKIIVKDQESKQNVGKRFHKKAS